MARISGTVLATAYVGLLSSFVIQLRWLGGPSEGLLALAALIATAKGADVGAYTLGRLAGRHKLWPRLSPNKTVEGALGGMIFGVAGALAVEALARYGLHVPLLGWSAAVGFGLVVGATAQLGDLMESMIKRDCARRTHRTPCPVSAACSTCSIRSCSPGRSRTATGCSSDREARGRRPATHCLFLFGAIIIRDDGERTAPVGSAPGVRSASRTETLGGFMSEATISLESHDEELAVLGSRDQLLRQVRDALRVKVLARHGELRIEGDFERVEQAKKVFDEMRRCYRRNRVISAGDAAEILDAVMRPSNGENGEADPLAGLDGHRAVRPRTDGQARYLHALRDRELVFCIGPAGTGKTYLAVAVAVAALRRGQIKKIVLVRPAVEAGEHLGFLPGDLEQKINPYLRPLLDALHDLMDYNLLRRYMGNDLLEIAPLAYMRGRTLNDAVIILDEGQNATIAQMKMFLTRMGQNAHIVVTGDTTQVDLPPGTVSGLTDAVRRLRQVPGVAVVTLDKRDIVRHPLVQAIVDAYEETEPAPAALPCVEIAALDRSPSLMGGVPAPE